MKKLLAKTDVIISRIRHNKATPYYCDKYEMRRVMELCNEPAFCLYNYYRGTWFNEAEELTDVVVGQSIGWAERKVQRYRLMLEAKGFILMKKDGTVLKLYVGEDIVALHKAGLPDNVVDANAFTELKKKFKITDTESLIQNITLMLDYYKNQ